MRERAQTSGGRSLAGIARKALPADLCYRIGRIDVETKGHDQTKILPAADHVVKDQGNILQSQIFWLFLCGEKIRELE